MADNTIVLKGLEKNGSHFVLYGYFNLDGQFIELSRDDINPEPIVLKTQIEEQLCVHVWKTYEGIYDKFDYCEKCDEKSRT